MIKNSREPLSMVALLSIFVCVGRDNTLKKSLYALVLILLIIMLPSCQKVTPTPFFSSPLNPTTFYSPSPTPPPTPTAEPIPTPQEGLGAVYGRLAGPDGKYQRWPGALFMAKGVPLNENPDVLIPVLKTEEAPVATIDPYGHFYFADVPPETYALVVWTPTSSYLISDLTRNTLFVTVKADETIDLGVVFTVLPP